VSSTFVCDASAVAALLLDSGPDGQWVTDTIGSGKLAAPALVTYEAANVIRRHEITGQISPDQAAQAHADLLDLAVELWPYGLLAARAWELRHLSVYDAAYVALAEMTSLTLITLDKRLAKAPGAKCQIAVP
jgi:predicted nucleic acid-binding protein